MPTIPTKEPVEFNAGDTVQFKKQYADFPVSEFELTYYLNGAQTYSWESTTSGSEFLIDIPSSETEEYVAGEYVITGVVSDGTDRFTVYSSRIKINQNPASVTQPYEARSYNEQLLDAIREVLKGASDITGFSVNGKSITTMSMVDLLEAEQLISTRVANEKAQEKINAGQSSGRNLLTRFTTPV